MLFRSNNPGYGDEPIMEAFVNKEDAEKVADQWTNDDVDDLDYYMNDHDERNMNHKQTEM